MSVLLHAVPLAGVCRKERSSPVPQVRARPEEMRCVGSKRTPEMGRDMLLAASIVKFSGPKSHAGYLNRAINGQKACPRGRPWPKGISGRVWARMVHSMPTRETPALDADVEAATRLV